MLRAANTRRERLSRRALATIPGMDTDYRPLIMNLHRSVHDDMSSARTRLRGTVELLEQTTATDAVADLRAVEQGLA